MIQKYFLFLSITIIVQLSSNRIWAKFYNGRFKVGSVGETSTVIYHREFVTSDWVELPVDHFDPANNQTFLNVCENKYFFIFILKILMVFFSFT